MSMNFDSVLPTILQWLGEHTSAFEPPIHIVRRPNGRVSVVVERLTATPEATRDYAKTLHEKLEKYSSGIEATLLQKRDLIDAEMVYSAPDRVKISMRPCETWLIDSLLTNQDWLKTTDWKPPVPTVIAYSIKGGVGRSLALTIFARFLSSLGKRVALVDLDLEAPGITSLIGTDLSDYGVTDWIVESLVDNIVEPFPDLYWIRARAITSGHGSVFLVPAWGHRSENYVVKLGRAYLTTMSDIAISIGLGDRLRRLLTTIADSAMKPDVILIDARAGLHDLGSTVVTQLGAEVMLFTRDEPQNWQAYSRLFEHLRLSRQIAWGKQHQDLRSRMQMVAALLDSSDESREKCIQHSFETWLDFYDQESGNGAPEVSFESHDTMAPHYPIPILYADILRGFPGWGRGTTIGEDILEIAFREFCRTWATRLGFLDGER